MSGEREARPSERAEGTPRAERKRNSPSAPIGGDQGQRRGLISLAEQRSSRRILGKAQPSLKLRHRFAVRPELALFTLIRFYQRHHARVLGGLPPGSRRNLLAHRLESLGNMRKVIQVVVHLRRQPSPEHIPVAA